MVLDLSADGTKILPEVINGDTMPTIEGQNSLPPVAGSFEFATDAVRNNPLNVWAPLRHGDRSALLPVDKDNDIRMWSGSEENLLDDIRTGLLGLDARPGGPRPDEGSAAQRAGRDRP